MEKLKAATPPPGDAGERARAVWNELRAVVADPRGQSYAGFEELSIGIIAAALQSERTAAASQARPDEARAYAYLQHLLSVVAPQCEPLPDLIGLCTQVDSAIVWVREQAASQARGNTLAEIARWYESFLSGDFGFIPLTQIPKAIRALDTPQESA